MNVDLGKYASDVLAAYGVGIAVLTVLVLAYVFRHRRMSRNLLDQESKSND